MKDNVPHFKANEEEEHPATVASFIRPIFRPAHSKLFGMKRGLLSMLLFFLGIGAVVLAKFVNPGWSLAAAILLLTAYGVLQESDGNLRKLYWSN